MPTLAPPRPATPAPATPRRITSTPLTPPTPTITPISPTRPDHRRFAVEALFAGAPLAAYAGEMLAAADAAGIDWRLGRPLTSVHRRYYRLQAAMEEPHD